MPGLADYDPSAPLEQPSQQGFLGKLAQTWPARLAQMIAGAATLPGDVYQGNVSMYGADGHTNPEVINRAADLAGMVTGGAGVVPAQANSLRSGMKVLGGPERISGAALKVGDRVFQGINHGDAYETAVRQLGFDPFGEVSNVAQGANRAERKHLNGFITSAGRFVDRQEAMQIANAAEQASAQGGLMAHQLKVDK